MHQCDGVIRVPYNRLTVCYQSMGSDVIMILCNKSANSGFMGKRTCVLFFFYSVMCVLLDFFFFTALCVFVQKNAIKKLVPAFL